MSSLKLNPEENIENSTEQLKKAKQRLCQYEKQLSSKDAKQAKQIQEFGVQFKKKQTQIKKLCEQLKFLIGEHQNLKKSAKAQKAELEHQIEMKKKQNSEQKTLLDLFSSQKNGARYDTLKRVYRENESLKIKIVDLTKIVNLGVSKETQMVNLRRSNSFFKQQILKFQHEFSSLVSNSESKFDRYEKEIQEQRKENQILTILINSLKIKIEEQKQLGRVENQNLQKQFRDKIEVKDKQIATLFEMLRKQSNSKNEEREKLKGEIKILKENIQSNEYQLSQVISFNAESKLKCDEIKILNEKIGLELGRANAEILSLKAQSKTKVDEIKTLNEKIRSNEMQGARLGYLNTQSRLKSDEIKTLKEKIEFKEKQLGRLNTQLVSLMNQSKGQAEEIKTLKEKIQSNKLQLSKATAQITSLNTQSKLKSHEIKNLLKRLDFMKDQNSTLTIMINTQGSKEDQIKKKQKQAKIQKNSPTTHTQIQDLEKHYKQQISVQDLEIARLKQENNKLKADRFLPRPKEEVRSKTQTFVISFQPQSKGANNQNSVDYVKQLKKLEQKQERYKRQIQSLKQQNESLRYKYSSLPSVPSPQKNDQLVKLQQEVLSLRSALQLKDQEIIQNQKELKYAKKANEVTLLSCQKRISQITKSRQPQAKTIATQRNK